MTTRNHYEGKKRNSFKYSIVLGSNVHTYNFPKHGGSIEIIKLYFKHFSTVQRIRDYT